MSGAAAMTDIELADPELFLNREASELDFNMRVLALAEDERVPLLDRIRFLCISCSNLDEFFEVRVASIKHQLSVLSGNVSDDGLTPFEALQRLVPNVVAMVDTQYRVFKQALLPALHAEGIRFLATDEWSVKQRQWLKKHFTREILPVLSPLSLDRVHPFPRILNKSLNFIVLLNGRDAFGRNSGMALVRTPRSLSRLIHLPPSCAAGSHDFVLLSSVVQAFLDDLFPGMEVDGCHQFRVTRNSELFVEEDDDDNLARALKGELVGRGFSEAVRLEVDEATPSNVAKYLLLNFDLEEADLYHCAGPVNLNRLMAVVDLIERPDLKYPPFTPRVQRRLGGGVNLFEAIQRGDILLHHPFDAFSTVVDLLKQASLDTDVLAIKQTLYRTGLDSPLVGLLIQAARAGKDVTVVIELRARFDEEANIQLADALQEAGVQVVYGAVRYKTHAKMMLIVRRERRTLRRYAHLGTGNYHQGTARAYTDIGLLTCAQEMCKDVHKVFQQLSGPGRVLRLKRLLHSPFTLHRGLIRMIEREEECARGGKDARIVAKMNHLTEAGVICALYRASRAGVKIDLIVRSTCCLRPGIKGVSETITVRSVLGRFLEHSRVYWFHNGGESQLYCASADWMERNLFHRVETCFPVLDQRLAKRVVEEELENYLKDNQHAYALRPDGNWAPVPVARNKPYSAQQSLLDHLSRHERTEHIEHD